MEKVTNCEIFRSGVIIIESRLEHCYYDYTSGREELSFGRIAEVICDIEKECDLSGKMEYYLDEANRVDEIMSAKVSRQLVIVANGIDYSYENSENFQNDLFTFGIKIAKRLATISKWRARIETGGRCFIVTPDEEEY